MYPPVVLGSVFSWREPRTLMSEVQVVPPSVDSTNPPASLHVLKVQLVFGYM